MNKYDKYDNLCKQAEQIYFQNDSNIGFVVDFLIKLIIQLEQRIEQIEKSIN